MIRTRTKWLAGVAALLACGLAASHIWDAWSQRPSGLLVYGDSIVHGFGVPHPWPQQLRAETDAVVGRPLANDPTAGRRIGQKKAPIVWIAIGTNDYGKSKVTPDDFRAAYIALVDAIHSGSPNTAIYAQTPLVRKTEGPNNLGASLGEYRTAILTVCQSRPWITCIDGTKILAISDMPDGLHPGAAAQEKYANFVSDAVQL